jgi:hypothetical protein
MDRTWVHGKLFTSVYMDGVKELMRFVKEKFNDIVEILFPCSRCLNQKYLSQSVVKKHLLMNGMDTSYTRWIHHREDLNVDITEHFATDVHDSGDGSTDGIGVTEDDNYDADPWEEVLGDLRTGAEEEREVGEDEDGGTGPHEQASFFEKALRKRQSVFFIPVVPNPQGSL